MQTNWYAVYTKPKTEKKVSALLTKKKIENYLPLNRVVRESLGERRKMLEPLFPSIVFVRISEQDMNFVRTQSDVINFLFWLGRPVAIQDVEIDAIQDYVQHYAQIELEKTKVSMNNLVRITSRQLDTDGDNRVVVMNATQVRLTLPTLGMVLVSTSEPQKLQFSEEKVLVI